MLFRRMAGIAALELAASGLATSSAMAHPQAAPPVDLRLDSPRQLPAKLEEGRKLEVRRRLVTCAERVAPNVVRVSIERRVADGMSFSIEVSGLVVDPLGHIVTVGSTLEQAGRIAVYFAHAPQLRPRQARLLGVDDASDVGVLDVGPVDLPSLDLAAGLGGDADPATPVNEEGRYVVTLFGSNELGDNYEERSGVAAGWLHDPIQNPIFGRRRFEKLLQVTVARGSHCAGGVIAEQSGRIVGLVLQPPQSELMLGESGNGALLAIPTATLRRGLEAVLTQGGGGELVAAGTAAAPGALVEVETASARPWLGFGVNNLAEPEFLKQLGVKGALIVEDVFDASPALAAGLEPHDLLLAWNGKPLTTVDDLFEQMGRHRAGEVVQLECVRRLERRTVAVTLGAW